MTKIRLRCLKRRFGSNKGLHIFNDLREVYDYDTGKLLDLNLYDDKITSYINELNVSDIIITKDAFNTVRKLMHIKKRLCKASF